MAIPDLFTCEGEGISPPLAWSDVPKDAETLVLVMQARSGAEDVHWLIYDIPARRTGLAADTAPVDARVGMNDWGRRRYRAPCLTAGSQSYVFNLYALDRRLDLEDADWPTVQRAMAGHVLSRNVLLGSDG